MRCRVSCRLSCKSSSSAVSTSRLEHARSRASSLLVFCSLESYSTPVARAPPVKERTVASMASKKAPRRASSATNPKGICSRQISSNETCRQRALRRSVASGVAASASLRLPAGLDLALVAPSPHASAAPLVSVPVRGDARKLMSVSKALTSLRKSSAAPGSELTSGCRSLARFRKLLRIKSRSSEPGATPRVAYTTSSGWDIAYTARQRAATRRDARHRWVCGKLASQPWARRR
mmetsp:Transcript_21280/g.43537  ORF Transcript_21280/g.43537 Transcript_21280/m.43537 type:complete len:235 (-) Transcript_21280:59-763(-)